MIRHTSTLPMVLFAALVLVGGVYLLGKGFGSAQKIGPPSASTSGHLTEKVVEISMSEKGFTPSSVSIQQGDQVRFVNNSTSVAYWPASDVHPAHTIYPAFDAGKGILPGYTWTFTFGKVGNWAFHDHLHPEFHGTVVVHE